MLLLAGCEPAGDDTGPGSEIMGETRALNDASKMLETRPVPPEATPMASETASPTP